MNDYKELIENLQKMTERGIRREFDAEMLHCVAKAADAIEELVKRYNTINELNNGLCSEYCNIKKERDAYSLIVNQIAILQKFHVRDTKFYITSEDIYSEETALKLKAEQERDVAIKKLNNFIDEIELTDWYHICNGVLVEGSPNEEEGFYKAKDILKICNKYRSYEE